MLFILVIKAKDDNSHDQYIRENMKRDCDNTNGNSKNYDSTSSICNEDAIDNIYATNADDKNYSNDFIETIIHKQANDKVVLRNNIDVNEDNNDDNNVGNNDRSVTYRYSIYIQGKRNRGTSASRDEGDTGDNNLLILVLKVFRAGIKRK